MSNTLLTTKLYFPPPRPSLVPRPRLVERLQAGLLGPLTLISAPAGSGKTTVLGQWRLGAGAAAPVAWLSLDPADNDPRRFLQYLSATLDGLEPGLEEEVRPLLQSAEQPNGEAVLTLLINRLSSREEEAVLALDDLHLIVNPVIHTALTFLLDHLPPRLHLALLSRADPPLPLARLRARGQLVEIRLADLRFNIEECTQFLNQTMGLGLSSEQVAALEQRTEGWIAGLQLAALSMRGREDLDSFIRSFSGSNRFVLDYLMDAVFSQLSADVMNFLLRTSILERLSASLCDAVTGGNDSLAILNRLEQSNLFIVPLDDERHWYRYHHLFADLLFNRLEKNLPEQIPLLHRRAAAWYEDAGLMTEAVNHALSGNDNERLIRLVEASAFTIGPSDISRVASQLKSLPEEITQAQPWILIAQAWALVQSSHLNDVEPCLKKAEDVLVGFSSPSEIENRRMRGHIATIRGYCLSQQDDMPRAIAVLQKALEILPTEDAETRGFAAIVISTSLRWSGRLAEGSMLGEEALAMARISGSVNAMVNILSDLAMLQITQGKLMQAAETCHEAIEIAQASGNHSDQQVPVIGTIYVALSIILRERNEVKTALEYVRKGLQLNQLWGDVPSIFRAYFDLAKTLQVAGDVDGADDAIHQAIRIASGLSSWYIDRASILKPWQQLVAGNVAAAVKWAQTSELRIYDQLKFEYYEHYSLLTKILLATGKSKEALALSNKLLKMADSADALGYTVEAMAIQALVFSKFSADGSTKGKMDSALAFLEQALALAEPEGFVRTFVEMGPPMLELLQQARGRGIAPPYVSRLLNAIESELRGKPILTPSLSFEHEIQPSLLVEPPSEREMDVLRLLAQGCSDKKIAEALVIAPGTVHKHLKNIYAKLEVHNRTEAIVRAQELGLL